MIEIVQIQWTAPNMEEAQSIAGELLQLQLVACVNLIPQVESFFLWEGKIDHSTEVKVLLKTRKELFPSVQAHILKNSSYDVPEVLLFEIVDGNPTYLSWVKSITKNPM